MAIRRSCSHPILVGMVQFFLTGLRYYSPKTYQKRKVIWDAPCPVQSRDHTCTSCFHSWWISTRYTFTLAPYSSTEKFFRLDTSLNWSSALHWRLQTSVFTEVFRLGWCYEWQQVERGTWIVIGGLVLEADQVVSRWLTGRLKWDADRKTFSANPPTCIYFRRRKTRPLVYNSEKKPEFIFSEEKTHPLVKHRLTNTNTNPVAVSIHRVWSTFNIICLQMQEPPITCYMAVWCALTFCTNSYF